MSGVLAILLITPSLQDWLVFFINGYNMKQNEAVRIRWISRMPVGFSLQLLRFALGVLTGRLDRRLFMALQSHVSFSFDGEEQQSLSIRLLLGTVSVVGHL